MAWPTEFKQENLINSKILNFTFYLWATQTTNYAEHKLKYFELTTWAPCRQGTSQFEQSKTTGKENVFSSQKSDTMYPPHIILVPFLDLQVDPNSLTYSYSQQCDQRN